MPQLEQNPFLFGFSFLNLFQSTPLFNFQKIPFKITDSCLVQWLNTSCLKSNKFCNNSSHINSIGHSSMCVLNKMNKVWKEGDIFFRSVNMTNVC